MPALLFYAGPTFSAAVTSSDCPEIIINACSIHQVQRGKKISENRENINRLFSGSYYFCCGQICWSAILNWCAVGYLHKYIVPWSILPVAHFFHRCSFHVWDFVRHKTSETQKYAAFPILRAKITHGGHVEWPRFSNFAFRIFTSLHAVDYCVRIPQPYNVLQCFSRSRSTFLVFAVRHCY